jgi:hypothetical protein
VGIQHEESLSHLKHILQRMREFSFRLSREKRIFLETSVPFLGHVISHDGIRPNPKTVAAIVPIPKPKNKSEVKSFLGLVNFYGKFVSNLSTLCEPLYRLTRDDIKFNWTSECEKAFEVIKTSHFRPCIGFLQSIHADRNRMQCILCGIRCRPVPQVLGWKRTSNRFRIQNTFQE